MEVTPRELSIHRTRKDAWMAINGKLDSDFNIGTRIVEISEVVWMIFFRFIDLLWFVCTHLLLRLTGFSISPSSRICF